MADCQHRAVVRLPVEGLELQSTGFRFRCTKCNVVFVAALEGTEAAKDIDFRSRISPASTAGKEFRPDHDRVINGARLRWSAAGLTFDQWRAMLIDGGITETAFRRTAASLGFESGDTDQILAAIAAAHEESATD